MKFDFSHLTRSHENNKYGIKPGEVKDIEGEKLFVSINEKAENINEDKKEIVYVITSSAIDRYKEITDPHGAIKDAYDKAKKTVFFNHNYNLVVGRSLWEKQNDEKWIASLAFADSTDFSKDMWNLAKDGYVGMTSIGFIPKALEITALKDIKDLKVTNRSEYDPQMEVWIWRKWELLEWSLVGVGANPDAYEISKILQKGLIKSTEAQTILSDELFKLEITKTFEEYDLKIQTLSTQLAEATNNSEILTLKSEIETLNNKITGKIQGESLAKKGMSTGERAEYINDCIRRELTKKTGIKFK